MGLLSSDLGFLLQDHDATRSASRQASAAGPPQSTLSAANP
jgi:hypothetical protein